VRRQRRQNIRFLNTWQRWEGGHTHNTARYNYLNTKLALPGSWDAIGNGVRGYRSLQQGAAAFATTLEKNRGYAGLVQGLRTGDPYKLGSRVATGLQVWVSGQPNGNPGYAHKVLGSNFAAAAGASRPWRRVGRAATRRLGSLSSLTFRGRCSATSGRICVRRSSFLILWRRSQQPAPPSRLLPPPQAPPPPL
jgi:hypothetical protein